MANIYTSSLAVPSERRDKRISAVGSASSSTGGNTLTIVNNTTISSSKEKISFTASSTPTIINYNIKYALTYGQMPTVRLWTIDGSGNFLERSEKPKFIMVGGVIDSIVYDLAIAETGFIILS